MGEQQPTKTWKEYFSENYSYAVNGLWNFGSETFRDAGLIVSDLYSNIKKRAELNLFYNSFLLNYFRGYFISCGFNCNRQLGANY
jgi:hypothetical protein